LNVGQLLAALRERDIRLVAEGDRLRCIAPPGALTPELSVQIREAKTELLALLATATRKSQAGSTIPTTVAKGRFPLSFTQRRAVLAGRIAGALPTAFLLRGALDLPALKETLVRIVRRHMPLRTRFHLDGENVEQEVLPEVHVALPETDLAGLGESERQQRLHELLARLSRAEFDVRQPPLFRFSLVRLGPEEHVLHTAFNVLVFDGWSFDVFWQEMRAGYAAITQGEPWPSAPLPVSYEDFVAWQYQRVTEEIAGQATFWKNTLGDELPPLPLPTDRPRPRDASTRGKGLTFELPLETAAAIRRFAQLGSVTPQITMLAALYVLLARMGSTRDIVIASPVDARTQPSIEGLIGPFVNLLLLRTTVDLDQTFAEFVVSVRDLCLAAYEHQEFPLERLDVRSPRSTGAGFSPAFQIEFSYQQVSQRGSHMGNLSLSQLELESGASTNDITLWVKDWGERVAGAVEFKLDLFDRETVEHWVNCYKHVVRELVRNPALPLRDIELLGSEREHVLARLAQVSATPPAWAAAWAPDRAGGLPPTGPLQWQVIDDRDQLLPFGIPGQLAFVRDGGLQRTGARARLRHDGVLTEVVAETLAPAKARVQANASEIYTELELRLCLLFEQLLGVTGVRPDQDYFELGGNSLIAVRLFGTIQEQFGVRLPMATLLDAGTPSKLARAINQRVPNREGCVIRLKEGGDGPALFLIHDGDGETLLYRNLALLMPKHVAVYGIEPLSVGKLAMVHTTIQEAAQYYLGEIRKRQASGPYFLGGLCAGGLIAFELARQLEAEGEEIRHLALVESSPPQAKKRTLVVEQRWQRFGGLFRNVSLATVGETARQAARKLKSYLRYDLEHRYLTLRSRVMCLLLRKIFIEGKDWPDGLPAPTVREVFAIAESEYVPVKLARTQAVIYRATRGDGGDLPLLQILVDPLFGWQEFLALKAEVVDVPGGHGSLLRQPHVTAMAAPLRASFESSAVAAKSIA
jgi:thioesterase domain-containing protein/acyl carrier protein